MTKEHNAVSNWDVGDRTKPGERYVYRDVPSTPGTHRPQTHGHARNLSVTETRS
jgi:hypothetical protein